MSAGPAKQSEDELLPGTIIAGKYRVVHTLAQGGMAVVAEATHVSLGQRVAVKLLRGESARQDEALRRFRREAQIAAQLPGDHIARVTDVGQTEAGEPFLVMELLVGRDLEAELTARGTLPIEEAVDYVLQACEGVSEAHAAGLVHRDLKPGNLFLTRKRDGTPVIKVLDFGISKVPESGEHSLTVTSSNFGTPLYMSPEQIQSAKHVDARCDQHALGAILYALVTGMPPFRAESLTALAVVIATKAPQPLRELRAEVHPALEKAVLRALAKQPEERFPDIEAFARALAPFGGIAANSSIRSIASVLAMVDRTRGELSTSPAPPRSSGGLSQPVGTATPLPALPIPGPSAPEFVGAQTSAALTTAVPSRTFSTRRRKVLGGLLTFVAALGFLLVVVGLFRWVDHRDGDAIRDVSSSQPASETPPAPPQATETQPAVTPVTPTSTAAEPTSSAPSAGASGSAAPTPPKPTATAKSATPKPAQTAKPQGGSKKNLEPTQVFNKR